MSRNETYDCYALNSFCAFRVLASLAAPTARKPRAMTAFVDSAVPANAHSATPGPVSSAAAVREFLTFRLGAEEYGIDILRVQ